MSKQIRLTLPDDLYKTLKEQAEADDRQIANYIVHLLKQKQKPQSPLYFPPGVRTPVTSTPTPAPIHTMPIPENPDARPIITCDTNPSERNRPEYINKN